MTIVHHSRVRSAATVSLDDGQALRDGASLNLEEKTVVEGGAEAPSAYGDLVGERFQGDHDRDVFCRPRYDGISGHILFAVDGLVGDRLLNPSRKDVQSGGPLTEVSQVRVGVPRAT